MAAKNKYPLWKFYMLWLGVYSWTMYGVFVGPMLWIEASKNFSIELSLAPWQMGTGRWEDVVRGEDGGTALDF